MQRQNRNEPDAGLAAGLIDRSQPPEVVDVSPIDAIPAHAQRTRQTEKREDHETGNDPQFHFSGALVAELPV